VVVEDGLPSLAPTPSSDEFVIVNEKRSACSEQPGSLRYAWANLGFFTMSVRMRTVQPEMVETPPSMLDVAVRSKFDLSRYITAM
jgi:hypothetical protein